MRTTDNSILNQLSEIIPPESVCDIEQRIANRKISDLINDNPNLLIFPSSLEEYGDNLGEEFVCSYYDDTLETKNIMGFIGVNNTQLAISSRFCDGENDFFLHYMLQQVFSLNIFDFQHERSNDSVWDFLIYLFPFYLKKALSRGVYKEYTNKKYNNSNVKGSIDIKKHLRVNRPFNGKIAYSIREHSCDNNITQLIRHTIEYIRTHSLSRGILNIDNDTRSSVNQIINATSSFDKNEKQSVINENLKPFHHPYYIEYRDLQKICLMILRYEKISFGKDKNKVYGLLFDGAWLWEEYLNTILKEIGFQHPCNKTRTSPEFLFLPHREPIYPDFWREEMIIDAKYKNLTSNIQRPDLYQLISYMHVLSISNGCLMYPSTGSENNNIELYGQLKGVGGNIFIIPFPISRNIETYQEFSHDMKKREMQMRQSINNHLNGSEVFPSLTVI